MCSLNRFSTLFHRKVNVMRSDVFFSVMTAVSKTQAMRKTWGLHVPAQTDMSYKVKHKTRFTKIVAAKGVTGSGHYLSSVLHCCSNHTVIHLWSWCFQLLVGAYNLCTEARTELTKVSVWTHPVTLVFKATNVRSKVKPHIALSVIWMNFDRCAVDQQQAINLGLQWKCVSV